MTPATKPLHPQTNDWLSCAELHAAFNTYAVDEAHHDLLIRAKAALAQPNAQVPTDKELLELMPESVRDEFSYSARVCSDALGRQVKPDIFRVALNLAALEYARAVLDRWGQGQQNTQEN